MRISGVSVGKVTGDRARRRRDAGDWRRSRSTTSTRRSPSDTRAILRQKTLLGETYVELTPGRRGRPELPDGGTLPAAKVSEAVQLDEIFRTFDPKTRAAFQNWMRGRGGGVERRGAGPPAAFGAARADLHRREQGRSGRSTPSGSRSGSCSATRGVVFERAERSARASSRA